MAADPANSAPAQTADKPPRAIHRRVLDAPAQRRKPAGRFTREGVIGSLKTLAWVLPLTLLIWVYAEQQTPTTGDVILPVEIRTDATDRIVSIRSPADKNIRCELSGPKAGIERVRAKMLDALRNRVEITIPKEELPPNRLKEYSIKEAVAKAPLFKENAVTVTKCEPSIFQLDVDAMETRRVPVEARKEDEGELRRISIFQENSTRPKEVEVTAPRSVFEKVLDDKRNLSRSGKLAVFANVSPFLSRGVGTIANVSVPISFPGSSSAVSMPGEILCNIEIKPADVERYQIPSVLVRVLAPASFLDTYSVHVADDPAPLKNVEVVGPHAAIEALKKSQGGEVYAILWPASNEGKYTVTYKPQGPGPDDSDRLDFHLPKDVSLEGMPKKVDYTVTKR